MSAKTMYMHTLDGKPASYQVAFGLAYLFYAGKGHRRRAAVLVASRRQIEREQQACIAAEWREWNERRPETRGERPSLNRYGYILVEVPRV